jgi:hypothetical protein
VGPDTPWGPVNPGGPVYPVSPVTPVGPLFPVTPVGPGGPIYTPDAGLNVANGKSDINTIIILKNIIFFSIYHILFYDKPKYWQYMTYFFHILQVASSALR